MRKITAPKLFIIWLVFSFLITSVIAVTGTLYAYNHGLPEIDLPNGPKLVVNIIMFLHSPFLLFIKHRAKKEQRTLLMYISLVLFVTFFISSLSNSIPLIKTLIDFQR